MFKQGDIVRFVGNLNEWGISPATLEQAKQLSDGMTVESVSLMPTDENPNNCSVFCNGFPFMFPSEHLRLVKKNEN